MDVAREPGLAAWLVAQRRAIERSLAARLGERTPAPGAPESEALRRFRSFAAAALARGTAGTPPLDGVRAAEPRVEELLDAWTDAAAELAGARGGELRAALAPLADCFRAALRESAPALRRSGAPRAGRRAVVAAIDRVADAFLAIDVDERRIVDANPAAGALLATRRDALLGADARAFLPAAGRGPDFWTQLEPLAEGADARRFAARVRDARGVELEVEASVTRYARRGRLLALALLRPRA